MKQTCEKEESTGAIYDVQREEQYGNHKLQKRKKEIIEVHSYFGSRMGAKIWNELDYLTKSKPRGMSSVTAS